MKTEKDKIIMALQESCELWHDMVYQLREEMVNRAEYAVSCDEQDTWEAALDLLADQLEISGLRLKLREEGQSWEQK